MNYFEAIDYLKGLTKFGINLGLDRIRELLRRLGDPHLKIKVIHVGGTNGKGSTVSMTASILQAAGYKVGTFISPHLHRYSERFCINGEEISEEQVVALVTELRPHLDNMALEGFEHPTEFEVSTAMACFYFYQQQVDFAVLEVGLGGAIDSTNVVQPLVAVITNVSLDHMDYLGNTVREVAKVKAGIIKEGVPLVTATNDPEALTVIEETCNEQKVPITIVGQDVTWQEKDGQLTVISKKHHYHGINLSLLGEHQRVNAATAVATVEELHAYDVSITDDNVCKGLARVTWPGRFEVIMGNPTVVLDGAHNTEGARMLANTLKQQFPNRSIVLVLGMLGDKEREKVVSILTPLASTVVITKPNNPRSGDWQRLAELAKNYVPKVDIIESIPKAVDKGLELASKEDVVCITGSFYMLAEAREYLLKQRS
ncbi:MAG: bifunctional folylpolyglutamate synthase/dihydrofolate synthase [Firmicutes bacterium]|nr:bifunctional folylpolyglutamate synthase/dihydrofolate synthase [Bacillota bacterium]